jgi:pimeloyl-ACP methyl ester carboxylesterase
MAEYAVKATPHGKLDLIPDTGHAPFYENAERFNKDLIDLSAVMSKT